MPGSLFTETQKFDQPWIRILLVMITFPLLTLFGIGIYKQIFCGVPFGSKPAPDAVLIILAVFVFTLVVGINLLFLKLRLIVKITEEGLSYRFPPLIRRNRIIRREEIEEYAIRQYKPVSEYGGWGIRQGGSKTGDAYNVKGNTGLQLKLRNGKKILFGTGRSDALLAAMDRMINTLST